VNYVQASVAAEVNEAEVTAWAFDMLAADGLAARAALLMRYANDLAEKRGQVMTTYNNSTKMLK